MPTKKKRLGTKSYKGPVSEGWGRPIKEGVEDVDKALRQHIANAAGIPGDIDKNVRGAIGDILGLNKKSKPKSKSPYKTKQYAKTKAKMVKSRSKAMASKSRKA